MSSQRRIGLGVGICPHVETAFELKTNNGSLITGSNGVVGPLANCTAGESTSLTVTEPKLAHLETSGGDEGNATLSFTLDVGAFECPYGGTVPFTYETGPTHNGFMMNGPLSSSFRFCEEEEGEGEPPRFEAFWNWSTTNGSPLWIEFGP